MHLLTFEISQENQQLIIHGDPEGLRFLCDAINRLVENTKDRAFDHTHLMTQEWGGDELSSESQGGQLVNQVKIYCWKTDKDSE